jgi:hypothetical protein
MFIPRERHQYDNRIFSFRRDESRRVTAMNVALWRVKGVRFDKRQ